MEKCIRTLIIFIYLFLHSNQQFTFQQMINRNETNMFMQSEEVTLNIPRSTHLSDIKTGKPLKSCEGNVRYCQKEL